MSADKVSLLPAASCWISSFFSPSVQSIKRESQWRSIMGVTFTLARVKASGCQHQSWEGVTQRMLKQLARDDCGEQLIVSCSTALTAACTASFSSAWAMWRVVNVCATKYSQSTNKLLEWSRICIKRGSLFCIFQVLNFPSRSGESCLSAWSIHISETEAFTKY